MPRGSSPERERRYEHVKDSDLDRGGKRSHSGAQGPRYDRLYAEARRRNVHGRSSMDKAEPKKALGE
ncbi:hypothetical protein [Streptomyces bikiniensis]|uniref:hypothetical protein n=1 Tax=Streptomyces bikiniensis TaxID=1896 RepID=UPI0004BF3B70|nr:hypothetical protein [Streptomyces bikiniensis]